MHRFDFDDVATQYPQDSDANLWTAIIPAAGRGTRLGYDKPKILYPIAGRPILDWLIDLLAPRCSKLIFSLSPSGAEHVIPVLEKKLSGRFETAVLDSRGMADSIYAALEKVTTPYVLIIWGDQVAIRPQTLEAVMKMQEHHPDALLTMPIAERDNPYVHYATDADGNFTHVLEKREGATMPEMGQSDCGLFACDTKRLKEIFAGEVARGITLSKGMSEWNFLPLLPQFETGGDSIKALRLVSLEETIGVNDVNDAAVLEAYLKKVA
jgi:bifunctional N-acetylglucosamine-1-phosphate-uridyltransferase/glucosamine-1-phosphate-acetyltransferase GlmU-like protein